MNNANDAATLRRQMERLEQLVTVFVQDGPLEEDDVLEKLRMLNKMNGVPIDEEAIQAVARRLGERLNIDVDRGAVIVSRDFQPWLDEVRRTMEWPRWLAYKQLLIHKRRPLKVIDAADQLTDEILDLAGNPSLTGAWGRRGLVLGDVQSGKTGSYIALFNKAADAGYRLFILLSGNTEVLRQQTQARIDEGFIGRDSKLQIPRKGTNVTPSKLVGVGSIRADLAHSIGLTTALTDFRRSSYEATNISLQTNAAHPYVFVVKKNRAILNALISWLKEQAASAGGHIPIPVLMLDDESDYASINTREDTDPTAINQAIRDILAFFSRSSYVAFTATPFANIFIDHGIENDLFPRDFVYSLESPSNYVGSVATFGTADDVRTQGINELEDVEVILPIRHKSDELVDGLPGSLLDATRTFFLSNAIRDLRGDVEDPRAMLVNVSRFKKVQSQIHERLEYEVARMRTAIELHQGDPVSTHSEVSAMRARFADEYGDCGFAWTEVLAALPRSNSDVRVMLINSDRDRQLDQEDASWDRPRRLIAVGGDVLSRGLTLEGLCVSYFHRRVAASDTLMQMARWFGYRDGYDDLCRLWINGDAADDYRFAAESIQDLRTDLRLMLRQQRTPEDFGLAVRKHPGSLLITARNKMRSATTVRKIIGLAGRRLETTSLSKSDGSSAIGPESSNREALSELVEVADDGATYQQTRIGWHRWIGVDKEDIANFLGKYVAPMEDPFFGGSTLSRWVRRNSVKSFSKWDLVVARGSSGAGSVEAVLGRRLIRLSKRELSLDGETYRVSGKSRRLAGPTDLRGLLDVDQMAEAESGFRGEAPGKAMPERIYYPYLARPALIVYALQMPSQKDYLVALKVAIPGDPTDVSNSDGNIEYVINTVAQQQWLVEFGGADDDIDA